MSKSEAAATFKTKPAHNAPSDAGRTGHFGIGVLQMNSNPLYAAITSEVVKQLDGELLDEYVANELPGLPHHLRFYLPVMETLETDLTIHLWDENAALVIFRTWESDTALVGRIHYGPDYAEDFRTLLAKVDAAFRIGGDLQTRVESVIDSERRDS